MYVGNKSKIVDSILKFIPAKKNFIDLFCGTGIVGISYKRKYGGNIILNDIDEEQIERCRFVWSGKELPLDRWISRQEFEDIRDGQIKIDKGLKKIILNAWSFGNNSKGYIYGKGVENYKHSVHKLHFGQSNNPKKDLAVIYDKMTYVGKMLVSEKDYIEPLLVIYNTNGRIKRNELNIPLSKFKIPKYKTKKEIDTDEYKQRLQSLESLQRLQSLQRLESLESLESLQRLESLESLQRLESLERLEDISFSNLSYLDFDFSKFSENDTIVYLDPPYENTHEYKKGQTKEFDYDFFWDWFDDHPLPMVASSYEARPYVHKIMDIHKRITLSGATTGKQSKEKIFGNKAYVKQMKRC